MMKRRIICFLGPQGSGKGTQAELLSKKLGIPRVSTGDLYRSHIEQETAIGLEAKDYVERGVYAPDSLTNQIIEEMLGESMYASGVILDGFPRTLPQKEFLDNLLDTYDVIYIQISDDEVIKRITGRTQCVNGHIYHTEYKQPVAEGICDMDGLKLTRRQDDTPELLRSRLQHFHEKTEPLLDAYTADGRLHVINGTQPIDAVAIEIGKLFTA